MSKILFDDITEDHVIQGLREILARAMAAERAKDPTFRSWPTMEQLIDHIEKHGINDPWISVEDEMPDCDMTVLICHPDDPSEEVWFGYHDGDTWRTTDHLRIASHVTHWKQFPAPAKGEA